MTTDTAPATAVDDAFVQSFMASWEAAWNSHDPERVVALMTPDCTYDDAAWHKTMRGHDDVREFLRHSWRALPDLEFYDVKVARVVGEPAAMAHWRARATMRGPLDPPGYAPTNDRVEFDGFDYQRYRDGKVERLHIIFDMADVGRQIGAIPPTGSLREQAIVMLHRPTARLRRRNNGKS